MSQVALNVLIGARDRATPVYRKMGREITRSIIAPLRAIKRLTRAIGGKSGGLTGFFAGMLSVQAAGNFIKKLIEVEKVTEKILQINKTAAGSGILGTENLEAITEISERLGLVTEEAAVSFGKFATAGRLSGLTNKENLVIFEDIAVAIAGMRLSADDANGVFRAFQQILSKGTVQAEELRGQLGERLPGAFAIFAKSIGVTERQLSKMLERGEVLSKDTLPRFTAELRRTFSGAAVAGANSLNASLNRLTSSFNGFLKAINQDTPFLKALNSVLQSLTSFLTGDVAKGIAAALTPIFSFIQKNAGPIIALLAGGAGTVATAGVGALITVLVSSLGAVSAPLGVLVAGVGILSTAFVLLSDSLVEVGDVVAPLKDIVGEQFAQIVDNLSEAFGGTNVLNEFKGTVTGLIVEVGGATVAMSKWVKDVLPEFIVGLQKAEVFMAQLLRDISGVDNSLIGALKMIVVPFQVVTGLISGLTAVFALLSQAILVLAGLIIRVIGGILIDIRNAFVTVFRGIRNMVYALLDLFSLGTPNRVKKAQANDAALMTKDSLDAFTDIFVDAATSLNDVRNGAVSLATAAVMVTERLEDLGTSMNTARIDIMSKSRERADKAALIMLQKLAPDVALVSAEANLGMGDPSIDIRQLQLDVKRMVSLADRSGIWGTLDESTYIQDQLAGAVAKLGENRKFLSGEDTLKRLDAAGIGAANEAFIGLIQGRDKAARDGDIPLFKQFGKAIKDSIANIKQFREEILKSAKSANASQRERIKDTVGGLRKVSPTLLWQLASRTVAQVAKANKASEIKIAGLKEKLEKGTGVDNSFLKDATFGLAGATQRAAELREKQVAVSEKQFRVSLTAELKAQTNAIKKSTSLEAIALKELKAQTEVLKKLGINKEAPKGPTGIILGSP